MRHQETINGIRLQPAVLFFNKSATLLSGKNRIALLLEQFAQVVHFQSKDRFIIYRRQSVEHSALTTIIVIASFVGKTRQGLDIGIDRIQRKHRNTVVGIRIALIAKNRCIVNRQQLQHILPCKSKPIGHRFKVAKIAYTPASLTAQREERNDRSCQTQRRTAKSKHLKSVVVGCRLLKIGECDNPVLTLFPTNRSIRHKGNNLKGEATTPQLAGIECHTPQIGSHTVHKRSLFGIPAAKHGSIAGYCGALAFGKTHHIKRDCHTAVIPIDTAAVALRNNPVCI